MSAEAVHGSASSSASSASAMIHALVPDMKSPHLLFFPATSYRIAPGLSTPFYSSSDTAQYTSADKTFLLADSSKYAKFSPWLVAGVERFDHIITDGCLPAEAQAALEAASARLIIAA